MSGDIEWRLKQMQDDMNIMWSRLNDLEEARDEKVEPYDVMDSFRATKPDAGEPVNRYLVECLQENARLIEENDVLRYQYEAMKNETVRCKEQIADLEKKLDGERAAALNLEKSSGQWQQKYHGLQAVTEKLENDNKYWEERVEKLQMENGDLRWGFDHPALVEYQTARECTEIVNRIKNEPLTTVSTHREWMVAICEDIEAAIKKEFNLNE